MLVRFSLLFAACLAFCSPVVADDVALIRVGDVWRFFRGYVEPSNPIEAWRQPTFNDASWLQGISGFGVGYAYPEASTLAYQLDFGALYIRRKFQAPDPASIKSLVLRVDYDDGFVAYLNGQEVVRKWMPGEPGTPVVFNTPASFQHNRGATEEIDLSGAIPLLKAGENVLAIQVHNSATQFDYDLALNVELLANFTRGPFIQNTSTNSTMVIWKTLLPGDSVVEYGTSVDLGSTVATVEAVTNHVATLVGLAADTTYFYRAATTVGATTMVSPVHSFRTLKASGPFSFVVYGDSGYGGDAQHRVAAVIEALKPDLVLHAGDVIYPSFVFEWSDLRLMSVYRPHMKSTPYFFTMGNHDLYSGNQPYFQTLYLPTNSLSADEHLAAKTHPELFYSFDHGDAHFVVAFAPYMSQYTPKVGDAQYNWLAADLAASSKPWKFMLIHHPLVTSGPHRFDDFNFNGRKDYLDVMDVFLPLAVTNGVQIVFAGHDHDFERFNPIQGVYSVVSGGGGVGLYGYAGRDEGSSQFFSRHHCVRVTVDGDTLLLQAVDLLGRLMDYMYIQRALPQIGVFDATWATPVIETRPADDLDGNIAGQQFDLAGTSLPTLAGKFSNLGRVYVNNDRTNLYVGFEQAMISADNNVFLFVGSRSAAGVTNMASLGNGLTDPAGEGADGLDVLENLSFTNFAPVVGCILGDEYADRQFRSFSRSNLALNIGQGVFKLDQQLGDVTGARLQQFNRPIQVAFPGHYGWNYEQNADFIEVAIPLSAIGPVQQGEIVEIAAVVGGPEFNTNTFTRQIDSSFLGRNLIAVTPDSFALEPVAVRLAIDPDPDSDGLLDVDELRLGTDRLNPDSDGDSLLDGWEARFNLNPLAAAGLDGGTADLDNDGLTNLQEQAAGSNPRLADTDFDGLPDAWEVANQFNSASSAGVHGALGDPDGDRLTNAQEFAAGTNPRDARSALRVRALALTPTRFRLAWDTVAGRKYQLLVSTNAARPFTNVSAGFPMTANGTELSFDEDESVEPSAARFYRVKLVP